MGSGRYGRIGGSTIIIALESKTNGSSRSNSSLVSGVLVLVPSTGTSGLEL